MRVVVVAVCLGVLAGCVTTREPTETTGGASMAAARVPEPELAETARPPLDPRTAARNFREVVARVEPVAEAFCRERTADKPGYPCDVRVGIDARLGMEPNAFLTVDNAGRPTILFTMRLIEMARSQDELAFTFGHEMGHLLGRHIQKVLSGEPEATMVGAAADTCAVAKIGRGPGGWMVLHEFEREADLIGAEIAKRAGYDPALGVLIVARLADRGASECLGDGGTHPGSTKRIEAVIAAARAI